VSEVAQKHEQTALSLAAQAPVANVPAVISRKRVPKVRDTDSLMGAIISAGTTPGVNVENIERMANLYERLEAKKAERAFNVALVAMKPELPVIDRRGRIEVRAKGPTGQRDGEILQSTSFAYWEDIDEAITPILAKHGFVLTFRCGSLPDGRITVTGVLSHDGGHSTETTMTLPLDSTGSKNNVQAVGSSTSYGKRYTATLLLNIRTKGEDDDGKAGGESACIDESQAIQLTDLAAKAFPDPKGTAHLIARICKKFGIENTTQMKSSDFQAACRLLNDTITSVRDKARAAQQGETK
jgi:hypothetical protein